MNSLTCPLSIIYAALIKLSNSFENLQILAFNAFPLPPGKCPTAIFYLTWFQSYLLHNPLITSWIKPSPLTTIIPLNYNNYYVVNYKIYSSACLEWVVMTAENLIFVLLR